MLTEDKFNYISSETTPTLAKVFAIPTSLFIVFNLTFLYGQAIYFLPMVYFNFLATLFYAVSIGLTVLLVGYLYKIRSKRFNYLNAIVSAVFGLYFGWYVYLLMPEIGVVRLIEFYSYASLLLQPKEIALFVQYFYEEMYYHVFIFKIDGLTHLIIWTIEFGLVITGALFTTIKYPTLPFSESKNKWYKKYHLTKDFEAILFSQQFIEELAQKGIQVIDELKLGRANKYARVSIYYLPEEESQYLSITNIFIPSNSQFGKQKTSIIHLMKISTESAKHLMKKHHKRRAYF